MGVSEDIGVPELRTWYILRRLFSELVGTFIYTTVLIPGLSSAESAAVNGVATGLLMASLIAIFGPVSGGHFNPAITIGSLVSDQIKFLPAIFYLIVQVIGALLGVLAAKLLSPKKPEATETESESESVGTWRMFGMELLFSYLIVAVAVSVNDLRKGYTGLAGALAIGLSITAPLCAVTSYRGSMNPARSLAVSVFSMDFANHWVFWAGPIIGGVLAGVVYRFILTVYVR